MSYPKQSILFVSGLDKTVNESQLYSLFNEFPISYLKIAKHHDTRESLGYAFVGFKSQTKAEEAMNRLNYSKLQKKTVRICWYNRESNNLRNNPDLNIYVKKIAKTATPKEFHNLFNKYGNIISAKLVEDEEGEPVGYGYALYENSTSANKAITEGNNYEFKGKKLYVGKFEKNRPKKPIQFNNIYVKNLPRNFTQKDVEEFFGKYGELGSVLLKEPDADNLANISEEKKNDILNHKFAFVCFKDPESAMRVVNEVPYLKTTNRSYNEELFGLVNSLKKYFLVPQEHSFKLASYFLEFVDKADYNIEEKIREHANTFNLLLENNKFAIKDKTDRIECYQALKKKERQRKLNSLFEKIKRDLREKYKFCNLYVKNLPDNVDDVFFKTLFEEFGAIRSAKTVRKELYHSYLGIKRSVKVSGYVCFESAESARNAKEKLNNSNLFTGLPRLYVDYHQSKQERAEILKQQMISNANKNYKKQINPHDAATSGINPLNIGMFGPQLFGGLPSQTHSHFSDQSSFKQLPHKLYTSNMFSSYMQANQRDIEYRRDFFGNQIYSKISTTPRYSQNINLWSKLTGIFVDMPDDYISKLLNNNIFFREQVDETINQLHQRNIHS